MSTLACLVNSVVAVGPEHEQLWELPMPAWAYGAVAMAIFLLLLMLTWFFRNMAHTLIYGPGGVREGRDPVPHPDHGHQHEDKHGGGH